MWLHGAVHVAAILLVALAIAALAGCGGDDEQPLAPQELVIATGNASGVYAKYGEGLATAIGRYVPELTATVRGTDGSIENLRLLGSGRVQIAFSLADAAADAYGGRGRFRERVPVRALARLYDNYVQVIVRDTPDIRELRDLAGRTVSLGAPDSGTAVIAERVLTVSKLEGARSPSRRYLDIAQSARALAAGEIEAFFWSGGLPTQAITDLKAEGVRIRLLELRGVAKKLRERYPRNDVYTQARVPRSAYGLRSAVTTVSVPNLLVVRSDLAPETAYRLTRLLFERRRELRESHSEALRINDRAALATYPVPLHEGAERWYEP